MCTVTILPCRSAGGEGTLRLACNRDEQRSRPAALPPRVQQMDRRRAAWPIDAAAGGTWLGVNDAGLTIALLNVTDGACPTRTTSCRSSRGVIIPELLRCETLPAALALASALEPTRYAPFRLVLIDAWELAEVVSDGEQLRVTPRAALAAPRMFTSSGLGDERVQGPRSALFREMVSSSAGPESQDAFHRHGWPDRPQLSVCMRRPEARTVSYTTVTLHPDRVALRYHPDAPDTPAEAVTVEIEHPKGGPS
jgi:hypothetical protein